MPGTPGRFEFSGYGDQISLGQSFDFHGGQLLLGYTETYPDDTTYALANFKGILSGFGNDPATDLIELYGFKDTSASYVNGVLTLQGLGHTGLTDTVRLNFSNLAATGHFVFATTAQGTAITWTG